MKLSCLLLLLTGMRLAAATVILDSKDHPSLVTTGSQATFGAQGFRLSVAGAGSGDTVAANLPLSPTADLNSITAVKAPSGAATAGNLFLKI